MIKRLFLGVPSSFPLKMKLSFCLAPIQFNWSCQFLSFLEILLEFFQDFRFWKSKMLAIYFNDMLSRDTTHNWVKLPFIMCSIGNDRLTLSSHKHNVSNVSYNLNAVKRYCN